MTAAAGRPPGPRAGPLVAQGHRPRLRRGGPEAPGGAVGRGHEEGRHAVGVEDHHGIAHVPGTEGVTEGAARCEEPRLMLLDSAFRA